MNSIIINFKEKHMLGEFLQLRAKLQGVACNMAACIHEDFGLPFIITDVWRDDKESEHHYYRAFDARSNHLTEAQVKKVEDYINSKHTYDAARKQKKVCSEHDAGLGEQNRHFHVKVWVS